jgi:hypothetical protein
MATTTNFGWTTPDDTSLVKDGALAIRTLGSAIDTSLIDLKGGTSGQVLTKASNTDLYYTWATDKRIVQIVTGSTSTQTGSSSATYADTTLTATITPTSSSNNVLVFVTQAGCQKFSSNTSMGLRLVRGATTILQMAGTAAATANSNEINIGTISAVYLDSPSTSSATTYKTQFNSTAGSSQTTVQHNTPTSTIILMEVMA